MEKIEKKRYYLIDALRGFTLLVMIGYHFSYDVFILYGKYPGWLENPIGYVWQQYICISFILICGFCASFSRSNLKRGILLNACGLLITLVTSIFTPTAVVYFGVLNFLGCALLLLIPVKRWISQKNWILTAMICLVLFFVMRHITAGYLGFGNMMIRLPAGLYQVKWLTPLGFPYPGFFSSDYFPILPWFFLFLIGYSCHYMAEKSKRIQRFLSIRIPFLTGLGQKSLIVYMLHQPVLMIVCMILF